MSLMRRPRSGLFIFVAMLCSKIAAGSEGVQIAHEMDLIKPKQQQLRSDLPVSDILLDRKFQLWMLGQKSLWRWNLRNQSLRRYTFVTQSKALAGEQLHSLASFQDSLFVASNKFLYRFENGRLTRFKVHAQSGTAHILGNSIGLWWFHIGRWSVAITRSLKVLTSRLPLPIETKDLIAISAQNEEFWLARDRRIFELQQGLDKNPKLIFKTKHPIRGITTMGSNLLAHTSYSLLHISPDGQLLKSIPVDGDRKLIKFHITRQSHGFLFSDRLLEIRILPKGEKNQFRLVGNKIKTVQKLIVEPPIVAALFDGEPHVYVAPNPRSMNGKLSRSLQPVESQ